MQIISPINSSCAATPGIPESERRGEGVAVVAQPPTNNMGAVNTVGLKSVLDWVSFTIPDNDNQSGLEEIQNPLVQSVSELIRISLTDFVQRPNGAMGYRSRLQCGNISILYSGSPGMGCMLT